MKYYSEMLDSLFDDQRSLEQAERKQKKVDAEKRAAKDKEIAERKAAAKKVEEKLEAYNQAAKEYKEALNEFCNSYGSFRYSTNDKSFNDLLKILFY